MAIYIRDLCSKCINEVLTISSESLDYTGLITIVKSTLVTALARTRHSIESGQQERNRMRNQLAPDVLQEAARFGFADVAGPDSQQETEHERS